MVILRKVRIVLQLAIAAPILGAQAPALWYQTPAANWSEALPIANGRLAAMVFGGVEQEHFN